MISYQTDGVAMPPIQTDRISRWVEAVAQSYDRRVGDIAYIFCNDQRIIDINRRYLQHDYYTDIITFDYSHGHRIGGDLFISLDTILTNSQLLGTPYEEELHRVIIHGILHLCSINDKGPGEREQMEAAEERALLMMKSIP